MSNKAKTQSEKNGKRFLQDAFHKQQRVLEAELALAEDSISHDGKRGDVTEKHFLKTLRHYLPNRYSVDSAIVIDSRGKTSQQMDVVIFDRQYTPTLLDQADHKYIPAEAVYAVLEVKPVVNKKHLEYAAEKAESVRNLHRTSTSFVNSGQTQKARSLFFIPAGLVAAKPGWEDGLGATFTKLHGKLTGNKQLDCVLAVNSTSFDIYDSAGQPQILSGGNALVFFLFRLLQKLQSLGTVPAIDWNAYASQLANNKKI